jgi:hypothetical protein
LTNVAAIAGGYDHSLALKRDGTVVGWGRNDSGQATPRLGLTNVAAIAAGYRFSLALKRDGTVVGWGVNDSGQATPPLGLSNVVAIAAGECHGLALKRDGAVVGWGYNSWGQAASPSGLSNVVAIAAGGFHSLALVVPPPPTLSISVRGGVTVLSWPLTAVGYAVESRPSLTSASWEPAPSVPVIAADRYVLTNSWPGETRYFRLRRK